MYILQTKHLKLNPAQPNPEIVGCGNLKFPQTSPVTLPAEFRSLNDKYPITDAAKLECDTRDQASSQLWRTSRQGRLTASNFSAVSDRKSVPSEKFLARLFQPSGRELHVAPVEHGKLNEKRAKEVYLKKFPAHHLHDCGLVVNPDFSFLGASPDGKICIEGKTGIIEIKCPFLARNMSIPEACDKVKGFCLSKDNITNIVSLKNNHSYHTQIQGQLMVTGAEFCVFIVYTHCDMHTQVILPDVNFMDVLLNTLSVFFQVHAKPYLQNLCVQKTDVRSEE